MVLKIFMKIFILIIIILIAVISVVYFYLKKYMDEPTKLLTTYYDNKKQIENIKGEQYYTPYFIYSTIHFSSNTVPKSSP